MRCLMQANYLGVRGSSNCRHPPPAFKARYAESPSIEFDGLAKLVACAVFGEEATDQLIFLKFLCDFRLCLDDISDAAGIGGG